MTIVGNTGTTSNLSDCASGCPANDDLFVLNLPQTRLVTASTCGDGGTWLTHLSLRTSCGDMGTSLAESADSCSGRSTLSVLLPSGSYYLVLDGLASTSNQGPYTLVVTSQPLTPTPSPTGTITNTRTETSTFTVTPTGTLPTHTFTVTPTPTPTPSLSPTPTFTATETSTAWLTFGNCGVGPSAAVINVSQSGQPAPAATVALYVNGAFSNPLTYYMDTGIASQFRNSNGISITPGDSVSIDVGTGVLTAAVTGTLPGGISFDPYGGWVRWQSPGDKGQTVVVSGPGHTPIFFITVPAHPITQVIIPYATAYPTPSINYNLAVSLASYLYRDQTPVPGTSSYGSMWEFDERVVSTRTPVSTWTPTRTPTRTPTDTPTVTRTSTPTPTATCSGYTSFGRTGAGDSTQALVTGDLYGSPFNLPVAGDVQAIRWNLASAGAGVQGRVGIYTTAGVLQRQSSAQNIVAGVNTFALTPVSLAAGDYVLAFMASGTASARYQSGTGVILRANTSWGTLPSNLTAAATLTGEACINAQYCP
jgi:hypothetical protein